MANVETDLILGNRYRLVRRIAVGGMGSVWEAQDSVLHRRVAVKLLSDSLSTEKRFAERFRREAQAAARLSHPNVAGVFDYGEDDGNRFIVMELVEGTTLADRLEGLPLDPGEAVRIVVGIASALEVAHEAGIVHRDVKPGNVMLTRSGHVKVLDFGIAAAAGAPITATGARMGTATYLSPEQAMGEPPTPASDIYSLGVVLYEMLAGRPPFIGDTPVGVAAQHVHREPPSLGELAAGVPPHVATACLQALAKDPARRPPSAAAFAAMLVSPGGEPLGNSSGDQPGRAGEATMILPPPEPTGVIGRTQAPRAQKPPGRPRGSILPILLLALVVALGIAAFALSVTLGDGGSQAPPRSNNVLVPDVVDMTRADAEKTLRDRGLEIGDIVRVEGDEGIVQQTAPPGGTSVAPGTPVTLYVGAAPQEEDHGGKGDHGNGKGKGHGGDG